jgi:hypothetical protein
VMAIWIGVGIAVLADLLRRRAGAAAAPLTAAAGAVVVIGALIAYAHVNVRRDYVWADRYARTVLEVLEPDAILVVSGDTDTGAIGYLNKVERVRPDVTMVNVFGLIFADRPVPPIASERTRVAALERFVRATKRPVYTTSKLPFPHGFIDHGLVKQVIPGKPDEVSVSRDPRILDYCEAIAADRHQTDTWTIDHRNQQLAWCGELLATIARVQPGQPRVAELLARVEENGHGILGVLDAMVPHAEADELLPLIERADALIDVMESKHVRSRVPYLRGFVLARSDAAQAISNFERSIAIYPSKDNSAVFNLLQLHALRHERAARAAAAG